MRFQRLIHGAGWVPILALLLVGLGAPRAATAQNEAPASANPAPFQSPKTSYALNIAVIRIELSANNRYGSGVTDDEFETLVRKEGNVPAVCRSLERFGHVTVIAQGTTQTRVGQRASVNVTGNIPQLQKYNPSSSSGGGGPTYTQNFYSSGVTGEFDLDDQKGPGTVDLTYHISLKDVFPNKVALSDGASMELMGSTEIGWDGLATVPRDNGVFVSHSVKDYQSQSLEYFVVVRVNRRSASASPSAPGSPSSALPSPK